MDENVRWFVEKQVERTIANLEKRNIGGYYVATVTELLDQVKALIPETSTVAVGDSVTLAETGIIQMLREGNYQFLDKYRPGISRDEKKALYRQSFSADTFMCSTNALTEAGELYNIDGNGSRVAAMLYGPEQVLIVAGVNKIVKDLAEAERRVRQIAAPLDAKRLNKHTPCASLGYCVDCRSEERICNDFVVIKGQFVKDRIKVLLVGQSLGY